MARYAVNKHQFEIDTDALLESPTDTPTYEVVGGLESFDPSFEDQLQTYFFIENSGFASNDITGLDITITFSGRRVYGDAGQDAIIDTLLDVERRSTSLQWTLPDTNGVFEIPCVITEITPGGGSSTDVDEFTFTVRLNGTPTLT